MSLLLPETGLLFWMIVSFGVVFFILAKYGFPVIISGVEKRNSFINDSLKAAHEAEEKLTTLNQQAEALMEKAQEERRALLSKALEAKKQMEAEAKEATKREIRLMMDKATAEIEESKRRAFDEIKDQIVDISAKIAGKVVGEELVSDKKQKELINRLLNEEVIYKS